MKKRIISFLLIITISLNCVFISTRQAYAINPLAPLIALGLSVEGAVLLVGACGVAYIASKGGSSYASSYTEEVSRVVDNLVTSIKTLPVVVITYTNALAELKKSLSNDGNIDIDFKNDFALMQKENKVPRGLDIDPVPKLINDTLTNHREMFHTIEGGDFVEYDDGNWYLNHASTYVRIPNYVKPMHSNFDSNVEKLKSSSINMPIKIKKTYWKYQSDNVYYKLLFQLGNLAFDGYLISKDTRIEFSTSTGYRTSYTTSDGIVVKGHMQGQATLENLVKQYPELGDLIASPFEMDIDICPSVIPVEDIAIPQTSTLPNVAVDEPYVPTFDDLVTNNPAIENVPTVPVEGNPSIPNTGNPSLDLTIPQTATLDFSPLIVAGETLKGKFPFSIPWDIYNSIKSLNVKGVAPKFIVPFSKTPLVGGTDLVLDFAPFEEWAKIIRWGTLISFAISLVILTRRLIGGGAS